MFFGIAKASWGIFFGSSSGICWVSVASWGHSHTRLPLETSSMFRFQEPKSDDSNRVRALKLEVGGS
eukprot:9094255-Pyramimonas_sp.AAC.1